MPNVDNPASYAADLAAMTDEEVFRDMRMLEEKTEARSKSQQVHLEEVLAQIALVEQEIEQRFPGQVLAPYKLWLRQRTV
jgi:hypothetical protein